MSSSAYLLKRNKTYYVRVAVPVGLRQRIGKHELIRSLSTSDLNTAKEWALPLLSGARSLFREVLTMTDLTSEQIQELTYRHFHGVILPRYHAWREKTRTGNRFLLMPSSPYEDHPAAPTIPQVVDGLMHPNGYPQGEVLFTLANEVIRANGLKIDMYSPAYKELAVMGMQAIQGSLTEMVTAYSHHHPDPDIPVDWLRLRTKATAPRVVSGITMEQLFAKYEEMNPTGTMREAHTTALRFWQRAFGKDCLAQDTTKAKAVKCEEYLTKVPRGWYNSPLYRDRGFDDLLTMPIPNAHKTSPTTIQGRLDIYKKVFDWAIARSYVIGENPFTGLKVRRATLINARDERQPYTMDELKKLFSSPAFTGCKGTMRRSAAGGMVIWDSLYWVPLMALHSGARMNELCQLHLTDLKQVDGIWVFDIDENEEGQTIKTAAGRRKIPVHLRLLDLGLLDYANAIRDKGHERLFPDITLGKGKRYSSTFSKRFKTYTDGIGLGSDATFHSFRHNLNQALLDAEVRDEVSKAMLGHENKDTHARYGGELLGNMAKALGKVAFPLDWEKLMEGKNRAGL
jgi:integrase